MFLWPIYYMNTKPCSAVDLYLLLLLDRREPADDVKPVKNPLDDILERKRQETSGLSAFEKTKYKIELTDADKEAIKNFINYLIFNDLQGNVLVSNKAKLYNVYTSSILILLILLQQTV